jgi:hypothetical protein
MSGSPLLVGADLTKLTPVTLQILTKPEVLAIDQDPLGLQGTKVAEAAPGLQVWSKALAKPGERAVLLLNRTAEAAEITAQWKDLGLAETPSRVKDLWTSEELPTYASYTVKVPPQNAVLVRVQGMEPESTAYRPDPPGNHVLCHGCDVAFSHVTAHGTWTRVQIAYVNPDKMPRYADLRVNGQGPTAVAFPPTGAAAGSVWVQARLNGTESANVLTFSPDGDGLPTFEFITVQ